ncbi:MAG: ATP-binding cassette domain-containing protein [Alphaproteobacteria bacterium]|nr:ATP-binding cassette domain-containing protein [Alphaproteobacteria bacterium]
MVRVDGLRHAFGSRQVLAIDRWQVDRGEAWLVRGASGSGKSTLLHVLAGLLRPSAGRVEIDGQDIGALSDRQRDALRGAAIGIVFQNLHLVPSLTLRQNLSLAPLMAGLPSASAAIEQRLARLGLGRRGDDRPAQLSRGEMQRVALARALINRPKLLLADEPTASLDDVNTDLVATMLIEQAAEVGAALVVATHDARIAPHFAKALTLS